MCQVNFYLVYLTVTNELDKKKVIIGVEHIIA